VSEEKSVVEPQPVAEEKPVGRRGSRSLFAPVVLIAVGVFFLLDNLGVVAGLDWQAAFRFWPLLLIFLGLNVLVTQIRPPLGSVLSLLVALAAVAVFGYLLLSGAPDETLARFGLPAPAMPVVDEKPFTVPANAARTADITLDLSNYAATIAADSGEDLLAGTIWTRTGLALERDDEGDHTRITVGERPGGFIFNPFEGVVEGRAWEFRLNPDTTTDLRIDGGNAVVTADLSELTLTELTLDAGNGGMTATLPEGNYDVRLDGGNGSIRLTIPEGVPVRVEYDEGNGSVNVDGRFERVSGDDEEGVYETIGYDGGGIVMEIDSGNGSVTIAVP
jgi:hypothetical protein